MAFADTIRTKTAGLLDIATLLENLVIGNSNSASGTSTINTTATVGSPAEYTGASVAVTVASGEKVLVLGGISVSVGGASGVLAAMQLREDSSNAGFVPHGYCSRNDTGGLDVSLFSAHIFSPSAGSHTYKITWWVGSNTGYSSRYGLIALPFQAS